MTHTNLLQWNKTQYQGGDGIVIATDSTQEWFLKWWWENYSKHNSYPVTFFDIGMSQSARNWCENKGSIRSFSFPEGWIANKETIESHLIQEWEEKYQGNVWEGRKQWFCKPYVLLQSPYDRTIWIDLDCEVRGSLTPLFDYCNDKDGFSILKLKLDDSSFYSAGVVVSKHGSPVVTKWAENIYKDNAQHFGEENVLIETLEQEKFQITPYSLIYNWPTFIPQDAKTVIRHHMGGYGKTHILRGMSI